MQEFLTKNCLCLKISLLVFISIGLCGNVFANFADTLLSDTDYNTAILEYKRLDFFSPDNQFKYQIGKCYENLGDYKNALKYYEETGNLANEDLIRIYLRVGDYSSARFLCEDLKEDKIMGWVYLMEYRYDDAMQCFNKSGDTESYKYATQLKSMPYKSPNTAGLISTFLPGGGEIYTGNLKSGLITFLLNGISGLFAVKSFIDHRYLDGTIITCLFWNRFYNGGIVNAESSADKYNKNLKQKYLNSIKNNTPDIMEISIE